MPDLRDQKERQLSALKTERTTFDSHWKELAEFVRPRRGRFFTQDRNKGTKRHQSIINSHATQAVHVARAGMMAGTMSPARPWFDLTLPDKDLLEFQPVKVWLEDEALLIRSILGESNFYSAAPVTIEELLLFATGAMLHYDDFEDVARFYSPTAGSYYISQDARRVVDTFAQELELTTRQMVAEFGLAAVSVAVKNNWDRGDYENWHPVVHFVEPNPDFDPSRDLAKFKRFRSLWYEPGSREPSKFLRHSGFDEFPGYFPRWDVTGEDVYGTDCPGITSLGDIKGLQTQEKRLAQAVDLGVRPVFKGPPSMRNVPLESLPGSVNVFSEFGAGAAGTFGPLYQVDATMQQSLAADIVRTERRIDTSFFVDLFMAITAMEGIQPRNQLELQKREAERLLQLGPVLERLYGDWLDKLITRTFNQTVRAGIMPEPPQELRRQSLDIRYVSSMAIAQRAVATRGIDQLTAFTAGLASAGWTGALDKYDADQAVDEYSDAIGAPAKLVVPDEVVAERREQRQAMIEAQQAAEMAQSMATTTKTAADAKLGDDNVLSRMTR